MKLLSEEAGAEDIDANDVDLEARHINEQKIEKLCGLTAKASLVVGLYVDKFPPPPRQLILAERLSAGGFWLSSKKRWVTGLNLLPLGSVHRLPLPEGAPPDTLLTGRALPVTLSSPPVSSQQLRKAMIKRRNLTADQVRQHVAEGRYNEKYTRDSTCLVWMHRLLSGSCGARDQRLVLRLLFSSFAVITQSVYTFGFKMIYFKVRIGTRPGRGASHARAAPPTALTPRPSRDSCTASSRSA